MENCVLHSAHLSRSVIIHTGFCIPIWLYVVSCLEADEVSGKSWQLVTAIHNEGTCFE
jgi:hypothetical protein